MSNGSSREPSDLTAATGDISECRELRSCDAGDLPTTTCGRVAEQGPPRSASGRAREVLFDDGGRRDPTLGDFHLQTARDRVLRVELQRSVERRGRLSIDRPRGSTAKAASARLHCRRQLRQLEIGGERLRAEIAGFRDIRPHAPAVPEWMASQQPIRSARLRRPAIVRSINTAYRHRDAQSNVINSETTSAMNVHVSTTPPRRLLRTPPEPPRPRCVTVTSYQVPAVGGEAGNRYFSSQARTSR